MCQFCEDICELIEEIFGHVVNPLELCQLIENSPLRCPTCGGLTQ